MWLRNLVFVGFCLAGLGVLGGSILPGDRTIQPESFHPGEYTREDFRTVVESVNLEFAADWDKAELRPAPRADALTICRRLSLGLTGTIPSLEEIRAIEAQPEEHRVQWWLSRLFEDRRYTEYVAERMARVYVGTENGPFLVFRRRRFVTWLADELERNVPYDELVRTLVTASGLWTDSPAVNFISVTLDQNEDKDPDVVRLARRASRAFLGVRLDCVQCHDDNLGGDWLQTDFHQLAAFFSDVRQTATGIHDESHVYKYKYLHADTEETVLPQVPFQGQLVSKQARRRQRLARWITHPENKAFARATVNRIWALAFGVPLVEPIDNIPLEGPYPPGLDVLAADFASHGYDVQRLIRIIAATNVFQRDSRADHELAAAHETHWAVFPVTRLRPEQVAGSVLQAASLKTINAQSHILLQIFRGIQENEFVVRYGDAGEDEFASHGGTIPQRLLMMNGNLVKKKTEENLLANASTRIAVLAPDDSMAVETAYLAVLTRRPGPDEQAHFVKRLEGTREGKRNRTMEDIYWSLLNSAEFSWNH